MRLLFTVCLICSHLPILAQDGNYSFGASNAGLAGASVTLADPWAIFNNVGNLGAVKETATFAGFQNRFNRKEFQTVAGGLVHPMKHATVGAAYYRFGGELYNQQRATIALSNQFQMVSLGAAINVIQHHIAEIDTRQRVAIELGGRVNLIPELVLGAHIFNLKETQYIPSVMKAGLSFRPTSELMINAETEKQLGLNESFKFGAQYQIIKSLCVRTGFSTAPFRSAFGFGLKLSQFNFDYAFGSNTALGAIHDLSLTFNLKK